MYLEEERTRELEAMFESELDKDPRGQKMMIEDGDANAAEGMYVCRYVCRYVCM